ncbi:MAG TPA: PilZ domain-containing protein [Polyangiaceae bacterium]|nr:PilZ domain-containing protein [Polyangiaceae bacterium]
MPSIDESFRPRHGIRPRRPADDGLTPPPGTAVDFFVRMREHGEASFYQGLADVVPSGVFLPTYRTFPVGTVVSLGIELPGVAEPIFTTAVVRWHRDRPEDCDAPAGMGLEMLALSRKAREHIRDFGRTRAPLLYDLD